MIIKSFVFISLIVSALSPTPICIKTTAGEDQNQYVRIASKVSGNDLHFLALLDSENGLWTPDRIHVNKNGTKDVGFCQINKFYHPEIVNDKRFSDPEWQLNQCFSLYKSNTKFYGEKNVKKNYKEF